MEGRIALCERIHLINKTMPHSESIEFIYAHQGNDRFHWHGGFVGIVAVAAALAAALAIPLFQKSATNGVRLASLDIFFLDMECLSRAFTFSWLSFCFVFGLNHSHCIACDYQLSILFASVCFTSLTKLAVKFDCQPIPIDQLSYATKFSSVIVSFPLAIWKWKLTETCVGICLHFRSFCSTWLEMLAAVVHSHLSTRKTISKIIANFFVLSYRFLSMLCVHCVLSPVFPGLFQPDVLIGCHSLFIFSSTFTFFSLFGIIS